MALEDETSAARDEPLGADEDRVRLCPACRSPVPRLARKCAACHEPLDPRFGGIDEGSYRFARLVVVTEIKQELLHWARNVALGTSVFGLLVAVVAYFGVDDVLRSKVRSQVDDAIREEVGESVEVVRERTADLERLVAGLELEGQDLKERGSEIGSELAVLQQRSRETVETTTNLNLLQLTRLRESMHERLARITVEGDEAPDLFLREPSTLLGERPEVRFAPDAPLRFAWDDRRSTPSGAGYVLEVGRDPELAGPLFARETPFSVEFVPPVELAAGLGLGDLRGLLFWRVRSAGPAEKGVVSPVGSFEFYDSALERMAWTGEVRIGLSAVEAPPFIERDGAGGFRGFDVGLARALVGKLGVVVEEVRPGVEPELHPVFRTFDWLPLLTAPARGQVDLVLSSITIKDDREELYDLRFTRPYYTSSQALVHRGPLDGEVRSLADLRRFHLMTQKGTSGERAAREHGLAPFSLGFGDVYELLSAVDGRAVSGARDPAVADPRPRVALLDWEMASLIAKESFAELEVVPLRGLLDDRGSPVTLETHPEIFDPYGIAVASSEERLLRGLDAVLGILEEGTLARLRSELEQRLEQPAPGAAAVEAGYSHPGDPEDG